jgi:hypothetical protein
MEMLLKRLHAFGVDREKLNAGFPPPGAKE